MKERELKTTTSMNNALKREQNVYARTEDNAVHLVTGNIQGSKDGIVADTTGGRQKVLRAYVNEK